MTKQSENTTNTLIGISLYETVTRFGSASAEFLKGLRGIDNETKMRFNRSLERVAKSKVHPDHRKANLYQQAGYAAEVVKVSRDNAEHIMNRSKVRVSRTEDVSGYGNNNTKFDHVELINGEVAKNSHSQMKFVVDPAELMKNIAEGHGGTKKDFSRYLEADWLDLPSEQVKCAKRVCRENAKSLYSQADSVEKQGKDELAANLRRRAQNYETLEGKIRDSGITRGEALGYRLNPKWEIAKDIAHTSHRAGMEGAKFGAAIGGSISLITNIITLYAGDKKLAEAANDIALTAVKSAGLGYSTAFIGSAVKGFMQQSTSAYTRSLASTSLPSLAVSVSLAMGNAIKRYATSEINETQLLEEVGATAYGMMSSTVLSAAGQVVIPIPFIGAIVGGMVGYTLSNLFYQSYLTVLREQKAAHEEYLFIREKCEAARAIAQTYGAELEEVFSQKIERFELASQQLTELLTSSHKFNGDQFAVSINVFAEQLGHDLGFASQREFDDFMMSTEDFKL